MIKHTMRWRSLGILKYVRIILQNLLNGSRYSCIIWGSLSGRKAELQNLAHFPFVNQALKLSSRQCRTRLWIMMNPTQSYSGSLMPKSHCFLLPVHPHLAIILTLQPIHAQYNVIIGEWQIFQIIGEFVALCVPSDY